MRKSIFYTFLVSILLLSFCYSKDDIHYKVIKNKLLILNEINKKSILTIILLLFFTLSFSQLVPKAEINFSSFTAYK